MTNLPQWHLHVTVKPHANWTLHDVASALERDVIHHGMKPVVITNHFRDPRRMPYKEIIPTKHFSGTEAEATRELFNMGVTLNNRGWRVKRLKIEGNPELPEVCELPKSGAAYAIRQRALYYETHIKIDDWEVPMAVKHGFAISSTGNTARMIATYRHPALGNVYEHGVHLMGAFDRDEVVHVEAAVLDTAPELDEEWLRQ